MQLVIWPSSLTKTTSLLIERRGEAAILIGIPLQQSILQCEAELSPRNVCTYE